ncbi:MAG: hypothetical protein O9294_16325 [Cytophagales bacterium]|nr:hypothetical protein [Cytophagales bacterium]
MNKKTKYSINGVIMGGAVFGILDGIKQYNEIQENSGKDFDWRRFLLAVGKGAAIGGAGGLLLGAWADYENSKVRPLNTDLGLINLSDKIRFDESHPTYIKLKEKGQSLIFMLLARYGSDIESTPRLGSTVTGTALKDNFDIDYAVNFKHYAFRNIGQMFDSVHDFFEDSIGKKGILRVRRQRKSIGVFVNVNGTEHKIDFAPCKLSKGKRNGAGYLHVNDDSLFGNPSYTKTNVRELNKVKLSHTQKRIVLLLKNWKEKNDLPLSSHLLQNMVLDAYAFAPSIPKGFTKKVVMVLRHIADNLHVAFIRGVENTNNVITAIPQSDKDIIADAAREVIKEYEYQPNSIMEAMFH